MTEKLPAILRLATPILALIAAPFFTEVGRAAEAEVVKVDTPSLEDYPDAGQAAGMVWHYIHGDEKPHLAFQVPQTDNELWRMTCQKQSDGSSRIANMIIAAPEEMEAGDQFGFSIRIDDRRSIGILARMLPTSLEGETYHMPQFSLINSHILFSALADGSRAYVNLNGSKFSIHLNGSGDALAKFLKACQ
ncbi:hypothetical protein [Sphingorhabdus sp. Alg231-15]|uniref:hypothetical protein n=1 Tax=Sphingorhabdus sp. Alg231-15 TaxID=1922222 RepID=UPI000D556AEF